MHERTIKEGPGWRVYEKGGDAWIKFNYKPDAETLTRLRAFAHWNSSDKAWQAPRNWLDALVNIANKAQTWESVGEVPYGEEDGFGPGPDGNS